MLNKLTSFAIAVKLEPQKKLFFLSNNNNDNNIHDTQKKFFHLKTWKNAS